MAKFNVGDRVRRISDGKEGAVETVSAETPYQVRYDGESAVSGWQVESELEVAPAAPAASTEPLPAPEQATAAPAPPAAQRPPPGPPRSVAQRDGAIIRAILETPWALLESKLGAICEVVHLHARGIRLSDEERQARIGAAARPSAKAHGAVMVLPLFGVISQRMGMMEEYSGGTSTEQFAVAFRKAVADPNIKAIVIEVDSPGGSAYGLQELADIIFQARGQKHIAAVANSMAASAAYWIASQADELVVAPGGEVGSVGVLCAHVDDSKMEEMIGLKTTIISSGKYKAELWGPLSDEAKAALQSRIDAYYADFVKAVARGRGVSASVVRGASFGEGRLVLAEDAVKAKMADRVGTLGQVLEKLGASPDTRRSSLRAEEKLSRQYALARRELAAREE